MEKGKVRYREEAINAVSSPEQLDQYTKVIRAPAWILLTAVLLIVITVFIWLFSGNISDGIRVKGIIFPQSGITDIYSRSSGTVTSVLAKEGDYVDEGQIIAILPDYELIAEIEELRKEIGQADANTGQSANQNDPEAILEDLVAEYELNSVIKSTVSGIVQSIVSKDQKISNGHKIATIINEDRYTNDREIIAYVPLTIAQSIKVGMEAQISPTYAPREEYGYMKGHITKVGRVPVTEEMLKKTFGDWDHQKNLLYEDGCVEVRIAIGVDPDSSNNFQWSNKKGRDLNIDISTICNVLIVSEDKRPIDLLLGSR